MKKTCGKLIPIQVVPMSRSGMAIAVVTAFTTIAILEAMAWVQYAAPLACDPFSCSLFRCLVMTFFGDDCYKIYGYYNSNECHCQP